MCILNNSTVTKQWTFMFGIPGIAFQMTLSSPAYKYKKIAFKKVVSFYWRANGKEIYCRTNKSLFWALFKAETLDMLILIIA